MDVFSPSVILQSQQRAEQRRCDVQCQIMLKELREKRRALDQTKRKIAMDLKMLNEAKDEEGNPYTGVNYGADGAMYYDVRVTRARNRIPLRKVYNQHIGSMREADRLTPDVVKARRILLRLRQSQSAKQPWRRKWEDQEGGESESAPVERQCSSACTRGEKSAVLTLGVPPPEPSPPPPPQPPQGGAEVDFFQPTHTVRTENLRTNASPNGRQVIKSASLEDSSSEGMGGGSIDGEWKGSNHAFKDAGKKENFNEIIPTEMMTPCRYSPIRKLTKPPQSKTRKRPVLVKKHTSRNHMHLKTYEDILGPGESEKTIRFSKSDRRHFATLKTNADFPRGKMIKHADKKRDHTFYRKSPDNELGSWMRKNRWTPSASSENEEPSLPEWGEKTSPIFNEKCPFLKKGSDGEDNNEEISQHGLGFDTKTDTQSNGRTEGRCHKQNEDMMYRAARVSFNEDVVIANYYDDDELEGEDQLFWSSDDDFTEDELYSPPGEQLENDPVTQTTPAFIRAQITYHSRERLRSQDLTMVKSSSSRVNFNAQGAARPALRTRPRKPREQFKRGRHKHSDLNRRAHKAPNRSFRSPSSVQRPKNSKEDRKTMRKSMTSVEQELHKALDKLRISPRLEGGGRAAGGQVTGANLRKADLKVVKTPQGKAPTKAHDLTHYQALSCSGKIASSQGGYPAVKKEWRLSASHSRSVDRNPSMRLLGKVQKRQELMTKVETIENDTQRSLFSGD